jgi:hypothetical protein
MKPHRFDPISFISGLVITLLGLAFLIPQTPVDVIDAVTSLGSWFWPVVLMVIGIAVLIPVFASKTTDQEKIPDSVDGDPVEAD